MKRDWDILREKNPWLIAAEDHEEQVLLTRLILVGDRWKLVQLDMQGG
jgi:hypothetical protein